MSTRQGQSINSHFAFKLKDPSDYPACFNSRDRKEPKNSYCRGICMNDGALHEFQLAFICEEKSDRNMELLQLFENNRNKGVPSAIKIPTLPEQIMFDDVKSRIKGSKRLPIGIERGTLKVKSLNLTTEVGKLVLCSKLKYASVFMKNIFKEIQYAKENIIVLDPTELLIDIKDSLTNYYSSDFDNVIDKIISFLKNQKTKDVNNVVVILSVTKMIGTLTDRDMKLTEFFNECEKSGNTHVLILDEANKIKNYMFDGWFSKVDLSEGLYVGNGVVEQGVLKISSISKELSNPVPPNYGFYIVEGMYSVVKLIEFEKIEVIDDDED